MLTFKEVNVASNIRNGIWTLAKAFRCLSILLSWIFSLLSLSSYQPSTRWRSRGGVIAPRRPPRLPALDVNRATGGSVRGSSWRCGPAGWRCVAARALTTRAGSSEQPCCGRQGRGVVRDCQGGGWGDGDRRIYFAWWQRKGKDKALYS